MSVPPQISFSLPSAVAFHTGDFAVAPCNQQAYDTIRRWPDWPQPVLVLSGPEASGKTHLAHIWAEQSGAGWLYAAELTRATVQTLVERGEAAQAWVLEDAGMLADEVALFHLLNAVREQGGWLLITGHAAPAQMTVALADLRSRLNAAPLVTLDAPDDGVLAAVIIKQFADRQLRVGDDVVQYLLKRMDRSFAAARDWVERIDKAALDSRRNITTALVRRLLESPEIRD